MYELYILDMFRDLSDSEKLVKYYIEMVEIMKINKVIMKTR